MVNVMLFLVFPTAGSGFSFLVSGKSVPFFLVLLCFFKFDVIISYPNFVLTLSAHYSHFSGILETER